MPVVGTNENVPKRLRGFWSIGQRVSFTDAGGQAGVGVITGFVSDDATGEWLIEVLPDGADVSVTVDPATVTKAGKSEATPIAEPSVAPEPAPEAAVVAARERRVASLLGGLVAEFEDRSIHGEGGKFEGSEPGPLSGQDRAEYISMIGGALLDEQSTDALNTVIGGDAVFATAEQVATLANLMETGNDGNPISAVTGSEPVTVTMPAFYPSDALMNSPESVEGMPRGADTFQMGDVFGGSTFPVYGIGSGQEAAELTTTIPNAPAAVLQVEVPPGHPSIGIQGLDSKEELGSTQSLDSQNNSNGIVLHPDTVFTTTSSSVDAKTGTAVVSVTASMPPGYGQNKEG